MKNLPVKKSVRESEKHGKSGSETTFLLVKKLPKGA